MGLCLMTNSERFRAAYHSWRRLEPVTRWLCQLIRVIPLFDKFPIFRIWRLMECRLEVLRLDAKRKAGAAQCVAKHQDGDDVRRLHQTWRHRRDRSICSE
jgi:hypothetical protein